MALLNISQAARASGKDRNTIKRYLKDGRLSSSKDVSGGVVIDSAELVRVFGALVSDGGTDAPPVGTPAETPENTGLHHLTIEVLMRQLQAAEEREKAALEREEWLKCQLEEEKVRSRELERRMLPPGEGTPAKKGFWSRVFGR